MKTLVALCFGLLLGYTAVRHSEAPIAATVVLVCGQPLAIVVTKRNGESIIFQPGDSGILETVKPIPKKDLHTFSVDGPACTKQQLY